ncbi:bifunctional [glutamate--ammonia ligase]-adenylyl-L-tyrosine phosphorylase/[glutamate--ammonia-ligase] adenylyltransferase [Rhodoferax sp.]|uniref:bifunctional [glutamate--ammonia ligase]-adenylyl-L-tyrosine phosphorylase/[glutamate--ammonia-ligase] adenylyltransferase n=1 Tax=Rhodoferax sp. TaxID=50421 RepID=UPI00275B6BC7|nr:bifunctional [glutamate--ammonia ligase]-adenylyl-L-tyrosine phosphorylase/[glutamate--ammonia-ligase] adenylyltransferase [Rhodoferax sp.]
MTRNPLSAHSRFGQRIRRRYEGQLLALQGGMPNRDSITAAYATLLGEGADIGAALRITRQLVLERLLQLDCDEGVPWDRIAQAMTDLAEFSLNLACGHVERALDEVHGAPIASNGARAQLWVIGMGKLGARELNVSSDIDLIYVYDEDGETAGSAEGRGRISNQEYFAKAVRAIYVLIGDTTEHGFVFRVDLALRPNGNSGPPAVSLDALEEYLHVQGREWERFAWLKSRIVAPAAAVESGSAQALRAVVLPFVFRRYLDYSVFDALRVLHSRVREHAARRSAGRPERANDVKLSRGGIREIEFIVQLLQVVRGGQFPELRTRPTLSALPRLARAGLMPQASADALAQAYVFLRRVEHRIQYLDDQQTHVLPTSDDDLGWIARTMGYANSCPFLSRLDEHRELVAQEFDRLLGGPSERECTACGNAGGNGASATADLDDLAAQLPAAFAQRIIAWRTHPRVLALRDESRARLTKLIARTAQWLREDQATEEAAVRLTDWIEPLLRRESYLALLLERPNVHARLLRLLGAARWPARYLMLHPGVIDELANPDMLKERFDGAEFEHDLEQRRSALRSTGEDDDEALLNLLRRAHHAEVFRTLARDIEGALTVEQVADDLSALAESVLRTTTQWCWERLRNRHRDDHQFAIIAYGKLGGKELGYGSDLDIVFVYEDADDLAGEVYASLVRKLINWLTIKTGEGDLYEIDTALRPNGNSGLLITSFDAYANYQTQRGSNTAWTWEHQAMTRARCVLGHDALRQRFDDIRKAVITAARDPVGLRDEIMAMRDKVRLAHPVRDASFDLKHSPGGMIDAEFAAQYLVLSQSGSHPELVGNVGNIALLERAEAAALLPPGVGHGAAGAYRQLRRLQHHARLNEESGRVKPDELPTERSAVLALWQAVFGTPAA